MLQYYLLRNKRDVLSVLHLAEVCFVVHYLLLGIMVVFLKYFLVLCIAEVLELVHAQVYACTLKPAFEQWLGGRVCIYSEH